MKRYRVTVSSAASLDTARIATYLATAEGIDVAIATDSRIDAKLGSLAHMAHRGRVVPELQRRGITSYRELVAAPYRIMYRVVRNEVWVVAVIDGRRDTDRLLYERARRDALGEID